jgi:hypothetical protein
MLTGPLDIKNVSLGMLLHVSLDTGSLNMVKVSPDMVACSQDIATGSQNMLTIALMMGQYTPNTC